MVVDTMKSSDLRKPEDTKATILEQLRLSTLSGGTDKVRKSLSTTGISDSTSAPIIQSLLDTGKELRKRQVGKVAMQEVEVQKLLGDELARRMLEDPINPLLGMPGASSAIGTHDCTDVVPLNRRC
jgi:hypothetical protein